MKHPFQRLLVCSNQIPSPNRCLLAAAGPSIYSFSLEDGRLLSTWSQEHPNKVPDNLNKSGGEGAAERDVPSSPKQEHEEAIGQKRKLSQHFHSTEDNATEERPSKSTKTSPTLSAPDVIRLISTNSGRHVVAVTGHDKCIRVFELQSYGVLKLLSER